jgi:hypothetical protein
VIPTGVRFKLTLEIRRFWQDSLKAAVLRQLGRTVRARI